MAKVEVALKPPLHKLLAFDSRLLNKTQKANSALVGKTGKAVNKNLSSRLLAMQEHQLHLFKASSSGIIGVDEVGRGCLSGPVVAAAVMLPQIDKKSRLAQELAELDDSKALRADQREELAAVLRATCHYAVGEASPEEIDQINILQASLLAMKRALDKLFAQLSFGSEQLLLLVDGNQRIKETNMQQITVIQGDSHSASIAAASVIAKVYRDSFMRELSETFPHYSWHTNKGYGSKVHRQAIAQHGLTQWHRLSFGPCKDPQSGLDGDQELDDENLESELELTVN
jgi:ribonuclease HII